jgi:hypothetical protein
VYTAYIYIIYVYSCMYGKIIELNGIVQQPNYVWLQEGIYVFYMFLV